LCCRFLISFAGKYLPCDNGAASSYCGSERGIDYNSGHQLYKMHIPCTELNQFGPAFVEVCTSIYLGICFCSEHCHVGSPFPFWATRKWYLSFQLFQYLLWYFGWPQHTLISLSCCLLICTVVAYENTQLMNWRDAYNNFLA